MMMRKSAGVLVGVLFAAAAAAVAAAAPAAPPAEEGFESLFDGKTLKGWVGATKGYAAEDGKLVCPKKGGGNLYTAKQYGDFVLRFDFKLEPGANNGLGIRAPLKGNPAYVGMELQILDNTAERWSKLKPYQYHGSIYGVVPAKRGHLKPVGQWNSQEVTCVGRRVKVILNGVTIVDADLDKAAAGGTPDGRPHPGLKSARGHIGFLGHGSRVEFRNIRIKDLPTAAAPAAEEGFESLFDGKTLKGWVGATKGYAAEDGKLVCPKKGGGNLYTAKQYGDFVLRFDFKLEPGANNGLGIRAPLKGNPAYVGMELQILDNTAERWSKLKPYQYHGSIYGVVPAKRGHLKPVGQWNSQEVTCVGRRVKVVLNGVTIVDADLDKAAEAGAPDGRPHPGLKRARGHIGFLGHGSRVEFRNIRIKDRSAAIGGKP